METPVPDFRNRVTLRVGGQLMDLSRPKVMGILNVTPDSFFDGGQISTETQWLARAGKMLSDGADIIDVGGYSSRPGAADISIEEEMHRVVPVIASLVKEFPEAVVSVDTFRSRVARQSVEAGASIINDISAGLLDAAMLETVADLSVPYIMMHMRGTPQTMATMTHYGDVVKEVMFYFSQRIAAAREHGISDIILDPGFGFAKDVGQNYVLLRHLEFFAGLGFPLLVGLSRKSMATRPLGIKPADALNATTALHAIALMKGARILRVHDVKEAVEVVKIHQCLNP